MSAPKTIHARAVGQVSPDRTLYVTTEAGTVFDGTFKDGEREAYFLPGAAILADSRNHVLVGPVMMEAAHALAMKVAAGDPRALTEPQCTLVLAVALLALHDTLIRKADAVAVAHDRQAGGQA
jgi:hypothetical protein